MTIDERLERLTERHEALTQTVELIAHMQEAGDKAHQKQIAALIAASKQDGENIRALARIAEFSPQNRQYHHDSK
jgi:hypothetical protein